MCLTQQFWENANKKAIEYEKKGYKFLASIMDELDIEEDVLYNLKWIQKNEMWSTIDIVDFELTEEGKKYIMYKDRPQLFLFKKTRFKEAFGKLSNNVK